MNGVYDDHNARYTLDLNCLVDTASDSKKFSLYRGNVNSMVNGFCSYIATWLNIWNWCSNVVLDTNIRDNDNYVGIW